VLNWLFNDEEIKVDRVTMQTLSTALRSIFAENILERAIIAWSSKHNSGSPIAVIEGIRRLVDIGAMLADPHFRLIYLECNPEIAYSRTVSRNENPGDAEMTYIEFLMRREAEAEAQIRMLRPHAHLVINNSGEIVVLHATLERAISLWLSTQ
jgi:dephospho-CoA kinase